jgi:opacity protein-like surface antigen
MSPSRPAALVALGTVLLAVPAAAPAGEARRVWLSVGGGALLGTVDWSTTSSWEQYQETAELEADYEAGPGPALEAALGVRVTPHLGLRAAFGWSGRNTEATLRAGIPHPLYFDRPRDVSGQASGLAHRQWTGHLDLEWRPLVGPLEVTLFGGPCLARLETDLVERVEIEDEFPFDTVKFRAPVTRGVRSESRVGWSAGAGVTHALGSRFGVGIQLRYTRVPLELALEESPTTSIDAGGLQLTAAVGVAF